VKYIYLANSEYEILEEFNGNCIIKDLLKNKYYFKASYFASRQGCFDKFEAIRWTYKDFIVLFSMLFTLIIFFFVAINTDGFLIGHQNNSIVFVLSATLFIFNMIVHEVGHMIVLRFFGRSRGTIKLKMCFFVPTLLIDVTDSYLLPPYRRIFVYYAGPMANAVIGLAILVVFPSHLYLAVLSMFIFAISLVPIKWARNDARHIFLMLNKVANSSSNRMFKWSLYMFYLLVSALPFSLVFSLIT